MPNENQSRGFGGFGAMVSDVSDLAPRKVPTPSDHDEDDAPHKPASPPAKPWWAGQMAICLFVFVGVIVLSAIFTKKNRDSGQSYSQPQQSVPAGGSNYVVDAPNANKNPNPGQTYTQPQEMVPAVGTNNVLGASELRYCQAQNIRLNGAQSVVNNRVQYEINSINVMIDDYNSRCANYRYKESVRGSIKAEVEAKRQQYFAEGVVQFPTGHVGPKSYR